MFVNVSVGMGTTNASTHPPNANDCFQILSMLNQGHFFSRNLPEGSISTVVEKVCNQVLEQFESLTCHTVARYVAHEFSNWGWHRVPGYLIRSSIETDFLSQAQSYQSPPYFTINTQTKQVITWLHHHSVVMDSEENLIECLPIDWYPVNEFVFIPHPSGTQGYFLHAI